jgi:hypothetical protein
MAAVVMTAGLLRAQQPFDRYVWETPVSTAVSSAAQPHVDALREEVDWILQQGHIAPLRYNATDIAVTGIYLYWEPGRIITTLANAYPYLTQEQQQSVRAYVNAELAVHDYRPWSSSAYMHPAQGARRESYAMTGHPPTREWDPYSGIWVTTGVWQWDYFWRMDANRRPTLHTLYGLWLYAFRSGDWDVVRNHWADMKTYYQQRRWQGDLYGTAGAHIAMARMAYVMHDTETVRQASEACAAVFSSSFGAVVARQDDFFQPAGYAYNNDGRQYFHLAWLFLNMVPEVGRFLAESPYRDEVLALNESGKQRFPLWWLYRAQYFTVWCGEEGVGLCPELIGMIFPVERWVARVPREALASYNMRFARCGKADCYVLEALAHTIAAFGTENWVDVRELTAAPHEPEHPLGLSPGRVVVVGGVAGYARAAADALPRICFMGDRDGEVSVEVYTLRGARVYAATVSPVTGGERRDFVWPAVNAAGEPVASGVYSVRVRGCGINAVRRFALVR